jgi:hypothetical protein
MEFCGFDRANRQSLQALCSNSFFRPKKKQVLLRNRQDKYVSDRAHPNIYGEVGR